MAVTTLTMTEFHAKALSKTQSRKEGSWRLCVLLRAFAGNKTHETLMLKKLYTLFGIGVVSLYSIAAMLGWEITGGTRRQLPPDARQNGYRSFHFWHYGLHGGK